MQSDLPPVIDNQEPVPPEAFTLEQPPEHPEAERLKVYHAVIQVGQDDKPNTFMQTLPELGYTPANFKALVSACKKAGMGTNVAFYSHFGIEEQTFYNYQSGARGMHYKLWQALLDDALYYLRLPPYKRGYNK